MSFPAELTEENGIMLEMEGYRVSFGLAGELHGIPSIKAGEEESTEAPEAVEASEAEPTEPETVESTPEEAPAAEDAASEEQPSDSEENTAPEGLTTGEAEAEAEGETPASPVEEAEDPTMEQPSAEEEAAEAPAGVEEAEEEDDLPAEGTGEEAGEETAAETDAETAVEDTSSEETPISEETAEEVTEETTEEAAEETGEEQDLPETVPATEESPAAGESEELPPEEEIVWDPEEAAEEGNILDALPGEMEACVVARVQGAEAKTEDEKEQAERRKALSPEELAYDRTTSTVTYEEVYPNTTLAYDLVSDQLKETLTLSAYDETLVGYRYYFAFGGLSPVLGTDRTITLVNEKKEPVFRMPAPYMIDAKEELSEEVKIILVKEGSGYMLSYLLPTEWLAESDRAWPVVLDPVITAYSSALNIQDQTVWERGTNHHPYTWSYMNCGYDPGVDYGREWIYLKFDTLPALTSADVVVDASIRLHCSGDHGDEAPIEVHLVQDTWNSQTITWANKAAFKDTSEDVVVVNSTGDFYWRITDIVRSWYANGNNGLMFRGAESLTSSTAEIWKQFHSSDNGSNKPYLTILFRNNNGLESYWDYTTSSAGRAGTGYINDYTGNLVWIRSDLGFGGNRMPVSIQHVYNANDSQNNLFGLGYGWRTNFNQQVYQWSVNSNYYVWEDGDGTAHYFYYSSANTYKDEDGLELTLTTNGSGNEKYTITDKYGNASYFDTYGRLTKMSNNQQTKSSITVAYNSTSGLQISTVTDEAGRVYTFTYTNGLLSKIAYKGTGSTEIAHVIYTYSGSNLTGITDNDSRSTSYSYSGSGNTHLLLTATDVDGYKLSYTYGTTAAGVPSRVTNVKEYAGSTLGGELNIEYSQNQTTFTDVKGNVRIMQFNNWGNTVCIQDNEGHAQYAKYATDTSSNGKGNQLTAASKLQNTVGNLLQYSGFETGHGWTTSGATASYSSSESYLGSWSLKVTGTSSNTSYVAAPSVSVPAGQSLTLSAWVKAESGTNAYLYLSGVGQSSEVVEACGWTRLEANYTNTTGAAKSVMPKLYVGGTAYMDCVQLEYAAIASRYNLVENGDFRYTTNWTNTESSGSTEGRTTNSAAAPELSSNVYTMTGSPTVKKHVVQTVHVSGSEDDCFVFGGWSKGDALPYRSNTDEGDLKNGINGERRYGIKLSFLNGSTVVNTVTASFNPDFNGDRDQQQGEIKNWQYTCAAAVAQGTYDSVRIELEYDYNGNTVLFDGIQLYKEEYGQSYTYDSNGNVTSVKDLQAQTTQYEYSNNNLTKEILPTGVRLTYTYDSYHNVLTARTQEGSEQGVLYSFTYDEYGNNKTVSIGSGNDKITSRATYENSGNTLATVTDAVGNTTTYTYNSQTNVLESVQYPMDSSSTKTEYTYDGVYRVTAANTPVSGLSSGSALEASYTYSNDNLTGLQTGTTAYTLTYGNFSLLTSIQINNERTLASYDYTTDRTNRLSTLSYGNGGSVSYTYDDPGRVTKESYEDGDTVKYRYDNDGGLASVVDSATGRTTTYTYDFTDRLVKSAEKGSGYSHSVEYGYDEINNLSSVREDFGELSYTTGYRYDRDNRLTEVSSSGLYGVTIRGYRYDGYGRIDRETTRKNGNILLTDTLGYNDNSTQVVSLNTASANYSKHYTYGYDANGNITSVSDGTYSTTYVYDTANELTRENNQGAGKTWVYTYDNGGNITSKKEYAYTTASNPGTPVSTVNYSYDGTWGDLLTSYGGTAVSSDTVGNITGMSIDGAAWSYTWEHGRQLKTASSGGTTWSYTYNSGSGLRTKRTDGSTIYSYVYNDGRLTQMTKGSDTLYFAYDASGPMSVTCNGKIFYYVKNLQGDVTAILDGNGAAAVTYSYDAWGKVLSIGGYMADTLGTLNPLRYRGYVYDQETGLYYLQTRYYNPTIGRFISADKFASTGQGVLGCNMFAYCNNNPVVLSDEKGELGVIATGLIGAGINIASTFIAAKVTGQDYTLMDAAVNGVAGFAGTLGLAGAILGAIACGGWSGYTTYQSTENYTAAVLSGIVTAIGSFAAISNFVNVLHQIAPATIIVAEDTLAEIIDSAVFGTGGNLCAAGASRGIIDYTNYSQTAQNDAASNTAAQYRTSQEGSTCIRAARPSMNRLGAQRGFAFMY